MTVSGAGGLYIPAFIHITDDRWHDDYVRKLVIGAIFGVFGYLEIRP